MNLMAWDATNPTANVEFAIFMSEIFGFIFRLGFSFTNATTD
jgi:hypothetical protein